MSPLLVTVLGFVLLFPTAFGFTWDYPVAARQCSTFTVAVNGSDVVFPLKVLLVPVGPSPLPFEVRKVVEIPFPATSLNLSFQLPYPTNSKFVGLVSTVVSPSTSVSHLHVFRYPTHQAIVGLPVHGRCCHLPTHLASMPPKTPCPPSPLRSRRLTLLSVMM